MQSLAWGRRSLAPTSYTQEDPLGLSIEGNDNKKFPDDLRDMFPNKWVGEFPSLFPNLKYVILIPFPGAETYRRRTSPLDGSSWRTTMGRPLTISRQGARTCGGRWRVRRRDNCPSSSPTPAL